MKAPPQAPSLACVSRASSRSSACASVEALELRRQPRLTVIVPRSIRTVSFVCHDRSAGVESARAYAGKLGPTRREDAKSAITFLLSIHCEAQAEVNGEAVEPK